MSTSRSCTLQGVPNQNGTATILPESQTAGLGRIRVQHPRGTFALTPASLISLTAICSYQDKLRGVGIDWGSGTGCLAIAAARVEAVRHVYGLEIDPANVKAARMNVRLNAVQQKVSIVHADSYRPVSQRARRRFNVLHGRVDFILANPPSSEGDDGFAYRREVLRGGRQYLRSGGIVFLSISSQYGSARIHHLVREVPGYSYRDLLSTTELVPFDLMRPDLLQCLELYAAEEEHGGLRYTFYDPRFPKTTISATSALDLSRRTGTSPLMHWQVQLFEAG